jgi:hypothetical protein
LIWLRIGTGDDTCECGGEIIGSIKCGKFLEYLINVYLLKKKSAPWKK